nr:hypothetical protein P9270_029925 [Mesorhizobium sp. WSM4875]
MQQVFYPAHAGEPCVGEYAIAIDNSDMFVRADIVLVNRHGNSASFLNGNLGRDAVLNRVLRNDLAGIRLQWIRLFVLVEKGAPAPGQLPDFVALEIKDIALDTDDYIARGNPCTVRRWNFLSRLLTGVSQQISYWSGHVVGGCARVSTSLENARHLDRTEIETLCARIGLCAPPPAKASPLLAIPNTWSSSSYH